MASRDRRETRTGLRRVRLTVALAVVLVTFGSVSFALATWPKRAAVRRPGVQRILNRLVKAPTALPGVVAVVRDRRGTWRGAAGRATAGKTPMRPTHRFRVGSVSKTFVAVVVLQLVEERKVRLEDTVERWLPGLLPYGRRVTVRELLNHTSGVYNYTDDAVFRDKFAKNFDLVLPPLEAVALAARHRLVFKPGQRWEYSNTGYELLGLIIERATGRPFPDELARRVLRPLGLRATSFDPDPEIRGPVAHGYFLLAGLAFKPEGRRMDVTRSSGGAWASAGIVSTAGDLARFYGELLGGRLLRPELVRAMKTTVAAEPGIDWGLGLYRKRLACGYAWGHDGVMPGYATVVLASEDGGAVVVLATNGWAPDVNVFLSNTAEKAYCASVRRSGRGSRTAAS